MHKFESAIGLAVSLAMDAVSQLTITAPVLSEIWSSLTSSHYHQVVVTFRAASKLRAGRPQAKGLFTAQILIGSLGYPALGQLMVFEPDWTETRNFWRYDFDVSYAFGAHEGILSVEGIDALHIVPLAEIRWDDIPANLRDQVARWL